jgi:hypothetical protein
MTLRSRTNLLPEQSGDAWKNGVHSNFGLINMFKAACSDNVSPGDNWPFTVNTTSIKGGRINGDYNHSSGASFVNFLADYYRMQGVNGFGHLAVPEDQGNTVYGTSAAARTSPSRPYLDVPVEVLQLHELPSLLRGAGRNIIRLAGSANLAWQYGLRPVIQDIEKLFNIQEQVDRRVAELERLKTRGLRRTIPLGKLHSVTKMSSQSLVVNSTAFQFNTSGQFMTVLDVGAHLRWIPVGDFRSITSGEMRRLARKAVLGLTVDLSTLWELLPWSWMADWCGNFGNFLAANRNIIPAALGSVVITRRTRTTRNYEPQTVTSLGRTFTLSRCEVVQTTKDRSTAGVSPTAQFPFLSGNQLGILSSLLATKGKYAPLKL